MERISPVFTSHGCIESTICQLLVISLALLRQLHLLDSSDTLGSQMVTHSKGLLYTMNTILVGDVRVIHIVV